MMLKIFKFLSVSFAILFIIVFSFLGLHLTANSLNNGLVAQLEKSENLIKNGSFEEDGENWTIDQGSIEDISFINFIENKALIDDAAIYQFRNLPADGDRYLELKAPHQQEVIYSQKIFTKKDTNYLLIANAKIKVGLDEPKIRVMDSSSDKTYWTGSINVNLAQAGWVKLGGIFRADSESISVQLIAMNEHNPADLNYYQYDNIRLVEMPDLKQNQLKGLVEDYFGEDLAPSEIEINSESLKIEPNLLNYKQLYPRNFSGKLAEEYENLGIPIYDLYFNEREFYSQNFEEKENDWVPAEFKANGQKYKVEMRNRGDYNTHYITATKSLRIDFKSPQVFHRQKTINLIRPFARNFVNEDYSYFIARKMGLIGLENQFIFLRVNDKPYGLMYEIEQWDKDILIKNQKSIGDLYSDEGRLGNTNHEYISEKMSPTDWYKYVSDPSLNNGDKTNMLLLVHLMDARLLQEYTELVNVDYNLSWDAHSILTGSMHQDYLHDNRLYFNTTIGAFELIPWDIRFPHVQIGDVRFNPFLDFLLEEIRLFDERNKILWEYLSDDKNLKEDMGYYITVLNQIKKALRATEHYSGSGERIVPYQAVEKSITDIYDQIRIHRKKIADLLKSKTPIIVTFKNIEQTSVTAGNRLIKMNVEPQDDTMFSSGLLKEISFQKSFLNQYTFSIYEDNGDEKFDEETDQCVFACEEETGRGILKLDKNISSKFHYETYINKYPFTITPKNFEGLMQSKFLNKEEKEIIKISYELDDLKKIYILKREGDNHAVGWQSNQKLKDIAGAINLIPRYQKLTYFIKGNVNDASELPDNVQMRAVNRTTGDDLAIKYMIQKVEHPIILHDQQSVSYELNPAYLDQPIEFQYHPEQFRGVSPKSVMIFKFFNQEGAVKSYLTYVLNGATNHWSHNNEVIDGVNYITILKNRNKISQSNEVILNNILQDQNQMAQRIGGDALSKENIGKIEMQLSTWFNQQGAIWVSYGQLEKYIKAENRAIAEPDITFQKATLEIIFNTLRKRYPNSVDLAPYQYLPLVSATEEQFRERYPFFIKDSSTERTYRLLSGIHKIKETIIIPRGITLIIEPGTTLRFASDVSLIAYGKIKAVGTAEKPITFTSLPLRSWGVVGLVRGDSGGEFEHCVFENGGEARVNGVYFSGMLSAYHTNATVKNCTFKKAGKNGANALSFKNGLFSVKESTFLKNHFNAIDFDFAEGGSTISNNYFLDNGNDGIDISGSNLEISDNKIIHSGDKGISVDENSVVTIKNHVITNSGFGIAVKDSSEATVINSTLRDNNVGVAAYNKKPVFGGAAVSVYNSSFQNNRQDFGIEVIGPEDSRFQDEVYQSDGVVYNSEYRLSDAVTREVIREPKKKTVTKKQVLKDYILGNLDRVGYQFAVLVNRIREGDPAKNPYSGLAVGAFQRLNFIKSIQP